MNRLTAIALFAAMTAAGCGSDSTGPGAGSPTFQLQVTGAITETATGPAYFGVGGDPGEQAFALVLGTGDSRHVIVAGREGSTRPSVGSYALTEPSGNGWHLMHMIGDGNELLGMFVATGGTVTITESNSRRMRGTISFTAEGFMDSEEGEIEGTVTFTAAHVTTMSGLGNNVLAGVSALR